MLYTDITVHLQKCQILQFYSILPATLADSKLHLLHHKNVYMHGVINMSLHRVIA